MKVPHRKMKKNLAGKHQLYLLVKLIGKVTKSHVHHLLGVIRLLYYVCPGVLHLNQ